MKPRKVLMLGTLFLFVVGFLGADSATARNISDQCKADIRAVLESCASQCGRDFRCFVRCVVTNFPASCR